MSVGGSFDLALPGGRRWTLVARATGDSPTAYAPKEFTVLAQTGRAVLPPVTLEPGRTCRWTMSPRSGRVSSRVAGSTQTAKAVLVLRSLGTAPTDLLVWRPSLQVIPSRADGEFIARLGSGPYGAAIVGGRPGGALPGSCGEIAYLGHAADAEAFAALLRRTPPIRHRPRSTSAEGRGSPTQIRVISESGYEATAARAWLVELPRGMPRPSLRGGKRFPFRGFGSPTPSGFFSAGSLVPTHRDRSVLEPTGNTQTSAAPVDLGAANFTEASDLAVLAWAPGHMPSQRLLPNGSDPEPLPEIKLRTAGQLHGRVFDAAGRPVQGAVVQIADLPGYWVAGSVLLLQTTTTADGSYQLAGVPRGDAYRVVAFKQDYGSDSASLAPLPPHPGSLRKDLVLKRDYRVSGVFTDRSGAPINGVELGVTNRRNAESWIGPPRGWPRGTPTASRLIGDERTDRDGRFAIVLPPTQTKRSLSLVAWEHGHVTKAVPIPELTGNADIDLGVLVMDWAETIEGTMADANGRVLPNASLAYARADVGSAPVASSPMVNPAAAKVTDGRFAIGGLAADDLLHLQAVAEGHTRTTVFGVRPADSPLEIVLQEGLELIFEITDETGRSGSCSRLSLKPGDVAASNVGATYPIAHTCSSGHQQTVRGVPPGQYIVEIVAPGHETWRDQFEFSEDRRVPVTMRSGTATVEGDIFADQVPLRGARVKIGRITTVSDAAGRFTVRAPTGWHTADVMDPRSSEIVSRSMNLKSGVNRVQFDLSRRRFSGRAVDGTGIPVPGANILLTSTNATGYVSGATDDRGSFALDVPAGRYTASVSSPRGSAEDLIDLTSQSVQDHVFRFAATGTIEVSVAKLLDGESAEVWMARSPLDRDYPLRPDADVLFSARNAPLGEWFLTAATSAGRLGFASVLLTEARPSQTVEIVLDDNDVRGSVRVEGRTKSGIAVFLMHEQSLGVRSTFSSTEGAFAFSGAQPGRYLLMAEGQIQRIQVPHLSRPAAHRCRARRGGDRCSRRRPCSRAGPGWRGVVAGAAGPRARGGTWPASTLPGRGPERGPLDWPHPDRQLRSPRRPAEPRHEPGIDSGRSRSAAVSGRDPGSRHRARMKQRRGSAHCFSSQDCCFIPGSHRSAPPGQPAADQWISTQAPSASYNVVPCPPARLLS